MFRKMRRNRQMLEEDEINAVLKRGTSGVLALHGDDDYPYAVPISYVYDEKERCFYFHGAKAGHKIDAIQADARASFCVIDQDEIVPEKFTTYFRSVIAFGKIHIISDDAEKEKAIDLLARKYSPAESAESRQAEISHTWPALCLLKLEAEHITGKEAIELKRMK